MSTPHPQSSVSDQSLQLVPAATENRTVSAVPPRPQPQSNAIVEYAPPLLREDGEDLEIKLRRILENVPVRVSNTSGSSAGSGSGDFHQYRQMRRREQDRVARMDADYQRRREMAEFELRREERTRAAEERTGKKRLKRQKKKQRRKENRNEGNADGEGKGKEESSDASGEAGDSENEQPKAGNRTS
ncbi:PRKR-interacting protein 1-like protein [Drosera capensis]